jgi:hypothetical protein
MFFSRCRQADFVASVAVNISANLKMAPMGYSGARARESGKLIREKNLFKNLVVDSL